MHRSSDFPVPSPLPDSWSGGASVTRGALPHPHPLILEKRVASENRENVFLDFPRLFVRASLTLLAALRGSVALTHVEWKNEQPRFKTLHPFLSPVSASLAS